uniref:Uncharacterized protein n=1 Tax=Methylophaga nitratireducenticrescens TaxID=754476 RepID=I1XM87_METNJ
MHTCSPTIAGQKLPTTIYLLYTKDATNSEIPVDQNDSYDAETTSPLTFKVAPAIYVKLTESLSSG